MSTLCPLCRSAYLSGAPKEALLITGKSAAAPDAQNVSKACPLCRLAYTSSGQNSPRKRYFFHPESSTRVLGYDAPWEDGSYSSEVTVSADLLERPSPCYTGLDGLKIFPVEKRRLAWGMTQIAHSGKVSEEALFGPGGDGKSYTLRPSTRSGIPLQWVHIGPGAIPNSLADLPCEAMTVPDLLSHLNDVLGTDLSLSTEGLHEFLDDIRHASRDFGEVYGLVREWWAGVWGQGSSVTYTWLQESIREYNGLRDGQVEGSSVSTSAIPPRRVWDLYSNRVLPGVVSGHEEHAHEHSNDEDYGYRPDFPYKLWTVSHGWVAAADRENIWTPINGNQWPAPLPRATTLEHVRIELLNLGAEYVWLDVLCLRQQGRDEDEPLRLEEWKIDVPTIGHIYRGEPVERPCATYFNGLGLPLDMSPEALSSDRHWINRVWTLQETLDSFIPCGLTGAPRAGDRDTELFSRLNALLRILPSRLSEYTSGPSGIFNILQVDTHDSDRLTAALRTRACTSELDRIAGFAYLLDCATLPVYRADAAVDDAWHQLLAHAPNDWRMRMLCSGADAPFALFPSWRLYVAADRVLHVPNRGMWFTELSPGGVDDAQRDPTIPGQYYYHKRAAVSGTCRVVGRSPGGDTTLPLLELHLDADEYSEMKTFTPQRAHGVLLKGVDYRMVVLLTADSATLQNRYYFVVVEVVAEEQGLDGSPDKITVIKWAVLQANWRAIMGKDRWHSWITNPGEKEVSYLSPEEAEGRTRYKDGYSAAFQRMKDRKDTLIIS